LKPRIFIASSVEGKDVADALQLAFHHDARCTVWHQAFPISSITIDALIRNCAENDFAIFAFSPDDLSTIRRHEYEVPRDNVLFEGGLFMGMHGRDRAFIVTPQGSPSFHIPSDLLGLTTATYDPAWAKTLHIRVNLAAQSRERQLNQPIARGLADAHRKIETQLRGSPWRRRCEGHQGCACQPRMCGVRSNAPPRGELQAT
jgi:predicted nucleotide-binding protein